MKVTKITKQAKTEGRYSIFIDDKFAFGLSELGLINSGIRVGQDLQESEIDKLKDQAEVDKAYNRALGLLARRPRSHWEMQDYLRRKSYDAGLVETVLGMLSERGFINDEDFARRWIENRRLLKPISKRKLSLELKQKRIEDSIIRSVLEDDETDELQVLRDLIDKKRTQSRYRDEAKLIRYLAGQGFTYGDIKQILSEKTS